MAYTFHANHGTNLELSEDGKTLKRLDPRELVNGVALTIEPLRVGETFEVILEETCHFHDEGSLEFGVTSNSPDSLILPVTMTECTKKTTYMISNHNVAQNKRRINTIKQTTKDIKVGNVIGVRLGGLGNVQFLLNGTSLTTVLLEDDSQIWGVVDLYGKPTRVSMYTGQTITPQSVSTLSMSSQGEPTAADLNVEESIPLLLEMMKAKETGDIEVVSSILHNLKEAGRRGKLDIIASKLNNSNGASIFTDYVKFIKLQYNINAHKSLLSFIDAICKCSVGFSAAIGRAGLLEICTHEVAKADDVQREYQGVIVASIDIVHSALNVPENIAILRQCGYVKAAMVGTNNKFKSHFVIACFMTLALVMEENEDCIPRLSTDTCRTLLGWMQEAINNKDNHHHHHGWCAAELCTGLANLAADFQNLRNVVASRGHVLFARLLLHGDSHEKECAIKALYAHTCPQSYHLISGVPKMLDLLRHVRDDWTAETRRMAAEVLDKLDKYVAENKTISDTSEPDGANAGRFPKEFTSKLDHTKISRSMVGGKDLAKLAGAMSMGCKADISCDHMKTCKEFLDGLSLPTAYFESSHNRCFCSKCFTDDTKYKERGRPPQKYSLPLGWCRFGLGLPPKTKALGILERWNKAFHGTKAKFLEKILKVGELAVPGHVLLGGEQIYERSVHVEGRFKPDGFNSQQIFVSPSIHYSGSESYATPQLFLSDSGGSFTARIVIEILIAPRSYKKGPQTIGATDPIDPQITNDEIEWSTNQMGSTVLYGVLVKLDTT